MISRLFSQLQRALDGQDAQATIREVCQILPADRLVLASSLGLEDQVLTHLVCAVHAQPRIFTLDTGRLFPETYETMERTMQRYGFRYEVLAPDTGELEALVRAQGPNLFYRSVALRKLCCAVRKTHPLARVLATADAWICGLRREQAVTRCAMERVEWDETFGLAKLNPLIDWTESQVWEFLRAHDIPYNPLHDRGYPSIGCAPCTRAVAPGADLRSGRWWWEQPEHKECGLHWKSEG
ncbi:MAG: phosphoadenylyl-sulfate reductase [Planctomycetes bacterium]|nr:phosphoadenylyl-sulfate reductase [Planctomycetota bacterium]